MFDIVALQHLQMTTAKRKIPSSSPPPPLRRSKLAECKDAPISVGQSSDGVGDEEMDVGSAGDNE